MLVDLVIFNDFRLWLTFQKMIGAEMAGYFFILGNAHINLFFLRF